MKRLKRIHQARSGVLFFHLPWWQEKGPTLLTRRFHYSLEQRSKFPIAKWHQSEPQQPYPPS